MTPAEQSRNEMLERINRGAYVPCLVREKDGWHARWRTAEGAADAALDEFVRRAGMTPLTKDAEKKRFDTLADAWITALRSETGLVKGDEKELAAFAKEIESWNGVAQADVVARSKLEITFEAKEKAPKGEHFTISVPIPKGRAGLRALGQAACVFSPLKGLRILDSQNQLQAILTANEAETFARVGFRDLYESGYRVYGAPDTLTISAEFELKDPERCPAAKMKNGAVVRIPASLVVRVAGLRVSALEVRFMLDQGSDYVFFREHWVHVNRDILKQALRALEKCNKCELTAAEALGYAMGIGTYQGFTLDAANAHGWLNKLLDQLKSRGWDGLKIPAAIPDFKGKLLDYQERGVAWMKFLTDYGFGALLADDMGLGKTVQTIAWYLLTRVKGEGPLLVVAPLSVVPNWRREFATFAPSLKVYVHLGDKRLRTAKFREMTEEVDVVITNYPLFVRDWPAWKWCTWGAVVFDEAQAAKNPETHLARLIRILPAARRVMLTGTPVENSALDIWSLQDYLNSGFLGIRKDFEQRFVKPLAKNPDCIEGKRLSRALEPFVLRRLKTDPDIARTLGPKREIKEYCELGDFQRREYEETYAAFCKNGFSKGDIFALLTALKLVCDGENKIVLTLDLLETIFAAGESVLIFTQYVKVATRIVAAIKERFKCRVPYLHGGLTSAQRQKEIDAFNEEGPCAFVLSLRAGGFGLNLTKATHVIHFDRWWNPAVENQATDRAHRIGQTQTVIVHTIITEGTLEERIDHLLEKKRQVAGTLVTGGESFLKSLKIEEIEGLVKL